MSKGEINQVFALLWLIFMYTTDSAWLSGVAAIFAVGHSVLSVYHNFTDGKVEWR